MTMPFAQEMNRLGAEPADITGALEVALARIGEVVIGKPKAVRLALTAILAKGHLLIEDLPGVGKTTLAQALARVLGLEFQRVQFTSDLLPADVLGVSVFEQTTSRFVFHPGPVFCQLVLADEINRASPKTQSALLEAMEERQITVEGETRPLPLPFFVVATQNPTNLVGTFSLPESQLDRFVLRIDLGYPDPKTERALLKGRDRRAVLSELAPSLDPDLLVAAQELTSRIHTSDALIAYVQTLVQHTRDSGDFQIGLSPRAGIALVRCARAWALLDGRSHVLPEDVQTVFPFVAAHRLVPADLGVNHMSAADAAAVLNEVPIP